MFDQRDAIAAVVGLPGSLKISAEDQYICSWDHLDGTITVSEVLSDRAAWIVIHADEDGQLGEIIGKQPIPSGRSEDVVVTLNALKATRTLHAVLYEDAGKLKSFEKDIDAPILQNGKTVTTTFNQIVE